MDDMLAFIDESGDPGRGPDASPFLVFTAILLQKSDIPSLHRTVTTFLSRYRKTELKFNRLKKHQRVEVFLELSRCPFSFCSVVVDKSRLYSPGFAYSTVLYKHFFGKIVAAIAQEYPSIELYCDKYGSKQFHESLVGYVQREYANRGLFGPNVFMAVDSLDSTITQVADLVAGAVGRAFGANRGKTDWRFLDLLGPRNRHIDLWPAFQSDPAKEMFGTHPADGLIREESERLANLFARRTEGDDSPKVAAQRVTLQYLLMNRDEVSTPDIVNFLWQENLLPAGLDYEKRVQWFRRECIAVLRDHDVLIGSRSGVDHSGYKLIRTWDDARDFVHTQYRRVAAMAGRAKSVADAVERVTDGRGTVGELPPDLVLALGNAGVVLETDRAEEGESPPNPVVAQQYVPRAIANPRHPSTSVQDTQGRSGPRAEPVRTPSTRWNAEEQMELQKNEERR
ncbi:MAG: DUF3800 domain-containing protein [Planctomycetota bacterium]|nr:DUF3800 domain-containing protein [Planctomycetota bacterium]